MHYFDRLIPDIGYIFSQVYSYTFFSFLLILLSLGLGFWVWGFQLMKFAACGVAFLGHFVLYMNIEKQPSEKINFARPKVCCFGRCTADCTLDRGVVLTVKRGRNS